MADAAKDDGLWAFPTEGGHGMTLRDYFAGKVISGLCANPSVFAANDRSGWALVNCTEGDLAGLAFMISESMLAERAKP